MARMVGTRRVPIETRTHGGAPTTGLPIETQLEKLAATCMLWEQTFYETGSEIARTLYRLTELAPVDAVARVAIKARNVFKLRHVPLYFAARLAKRADTNTVASVVSQVVQRPDEMGELIALYRSLNGQPVDLRKAQKAPLDKGILVGLRNVFPRFTPYQLAKYNRSRQVVADRYGRATVKNPITLKDVLFLTHPKPRDEAQQQVWQALIEDRLAPADTWEVALSAARTPDEKRAAWERLLKQNKLGGLAMLRNIRNMAAVGVDRSLIAKGLRDANMAKVLPYRFVAAQQENPGWTPEIEDAMYRSLTGLAKLPGVTLLVVDVSGSMGAPVGGSRSTMSRVDAAASLVMLARELADRLVVYATAGSDVGQYHATRLLPTYRGFGNYEAVRQAMRELGGGGIFLTQAMEHIAREQQACDRVIVVTDEQDTDARRKPSNALKLGRYNYILNVAPYSVGISEESGWTKLNGFSERVFDFVQYHETGTVGFEEADD